tara:strand:- start:169 stop:363 length:195 start_codon:yes stop_codon:yes gene_type:complete
MYEKILKLTKYFKKNDDELNKIIVKARRIKKKHLLININDLKSQVNPDIVEYNEPLGKVEVDDE